jgi:hypothetical protein
MRWVKICRQVFFLLTAGSMVIFASGCATPSLNSARANFYAGRFRQAEENLKEIPPENKDTVLYLMERGMIRHVAGDYEKSSADWRNAAELEKKLETYSLSQGSASVVINDKVFSFTGYPFEHTLIYTYLAKNYFAESNWDYAAICARNIISLLEKREKFPDIPYSRYVAAVALETINDGNAASQYRLAGKELGLITITEDGKIIQKPSTNASDKVVAPEKVPAVNKKDFPCELVCFVGLGNIPNSPQNAHMYTMSFELAPYAEFYINEQYVGRSFPLSNTAYLLAASEHEVALKKAAKTAIRLATKEAIASSIENSNKDAGAIIRAALLALEIPDDRLWQTLPLWLEAARVPAPANLTSYKVTLKNAYGSSTDSRVVEAPIVKCGNLYISFIRDIEKAP